MSEKERNYAAFISYRHKPVDREAAVAIQKKIEHFKVPEEYRDKVGGDRIGYCFRDEDELPASSSLSDSIRYALDHTNYLIVICTPDLPKSKWCEEEIRYFLSTHDRDHVLAVLAWGEPEESFSPLLTHVCDDEGNVVKEVEPLAANVVGTEQHISKAKLRKESVRICAALIGCPFDELWQRERRYRTRRLAALAGVAFAALSVFAGVVTVKNMQISRQNIELKTHEGRLLVDGGRLLYDGKDTDAAAENAMQALAIDGIRTEGAEKLLADARGAYAQETLRYSTIVSQDSAVVSYAVLAAGESTDGNSMVVTPADDVSAGGTSPNAVPSAGEYTITADQYGVVRSFDGKGAERWAVSAVHPEDRIDYLDDGYKTEVVPVMDGSAVLCANAYEVLCLSAEDGSVLWEVDKHDPVDFFAVSEDRSKFAVFDAEGMDEVSVYSVKDGSVLVRLGFPAPPEGYYGFYNLSVSSLTCNFGGSFTKDGRYFLLAAGVQGGMNIPAHDPKTWKAGNLSEALAQGSGDADGDAGQGEEAGATSDSGSTEEADATSSSGSKREALLIYCAVDTEEKTGWMVGKEEIQFGFNPVFGMDYDPQTGKFYFVRQDDLERKIAAGVIDEDMNVTYAMSSDNITMYRREVPHFYLEGNKLRAVCTSDEIYVLEREGNSFVGRYETGEPIIGAWWLDEEEDVLFTVQQDGTYHAYPLRSDTTFLINGKMQTGELSSAYGIGGGFWNWIPEKGVEVDPEGGLLYVDSTSSGKVIRVELFTDPHIRRVFADRSYNALSKARVTDDGSRLVITQSDLSGKEEVSVMDLETGEILDETAGEIPDETAGETSAAADNDAAEKDADNAEKDALDLSDAMALLGITDPDEFAGTVSMAFAANDRYLCLLDYSGEFRMYDTESGECVIRERNELFATEYGTTELYTNLTADGTGLLVRATETEQEVRSNAALYSLDGFEHLADIPNMIGYSEKTNEVILFRINFAAKEYYTCPLYSAQELVEWD